MPRKRDIEAAIAAYDATDREFRLPPAVGRLLAVMFPRGGSVSQRSLDALAAEGFDRRGVPRLLRALIEAGFLSKERQSGLGVANIYRMHLPPRVQP